MRRTILCGQVIVPDEVFDGEVWIENGLISKINRKSEGYDDLDQSLNNVNLAVERFDFGSDYIMPGLIDLHGDAFEKALQPRKGVIVPVGWAMESFQHSI
jgi:alpha-D-ribose 1-methylphosphonate 5-triphosphate diphosphatase